MRTRLPTGSWKGRRAPHGWLAGSCKISASPAAPPWNLASRLSVRNRRQLWSYRATLDAGGDPAVVSQWITETQAKKLAAEAGHRPAERAAPREPGLGMQGYRLGIPQTRTRSSEAESVGLGTVQTPGQVSPALKGEYSCPPISWSARR